jgi:hypothetical protein
MTIKQTTHFLIGIMEDGADLAFTITVTAKMVQCVYLISSAAMYSLPQKLMKCAIGFVLGG